eukprot:m.83047 g.83047  ORF g.83047 m.83047 type:complete len:638 (-) comp25588_c1_seq1:295-2208(-)
MNMASGIKSVLKTRNTDSVITFQQKSTMASHGHPADELTPQDAPPLKFKCSGPKALRDRLLELGWEEHNSENDYSLDFNLWWRGSEFRPHDVEDCQQWQRLNHFQKSGLICKKDSLARMLRKMIRIYGRIFDFFPQSFILPKDKDKFAEFHTQHRANGNEGMATWICKPSSGAQGKGIYLFQELEDLCFSTSCVVQRYIERPLLIEGYKFDLRVYVVVTSYHPLTVYMYREGLGRFSTHKYDMSDLTNQYSHLTNTSINKNSTTFNNSKGVVGAGCKWTLGQLRAYFDVTGVDDGLLWQQICTITNASLLAVSSEVPVNEAKCCELFGFDILVDEDLRPYLIEVNFSPSVAMDCETDRIVKPKLIKDYVACCGFGVDDGWRGKKPSRPTQKKANSATRMAESRKKALAATEVVSLRKVKPVVPEKPARLTMLMKDIGVTRPISCITSTNTSSTQSTPTRSRTSTSTPTPTPPTLIRSSTSTTTTATATTSSPVKKRPVVRLTAASMLRAQSSAAQQKLKAEKTALIEERRNQSKRKVFRPSSSIRRETPIRRSNVSVPVDLPSVVGDLVRIFPFNDATFEAASGLRKRFDMKRCLSELRDREATFKTLNKTPQTRPESGPNPENFFFPCKDAVLHTS